LEHIINHEHEQHHNIRGKHLFITIILNTIITLAQIVGGLISGSLALLSDALHNFSDVVALIIAWWANKLSTKDSNASKTFGYKRAEILATLFNASILSGIGVYFIIESIERIFNPQPISSDIVIYLAILGIVFNFISVLIIKDDRHENMNIKAAYLHLLTDVLTSIAVLIGGIAMMLYEVFWVDGIITIFIALYLIKSSFALIKDSSSILMQFTPKEIDINDMQKKVLEYSDIKNIHHIHIWQLNDKEIMLEAHIDFYEDLNLSKATKIIVSIEEKLREYFKITHFNFQLEFDRDDNKELVKRHCCQV
jgi:cobalt-zinc-cadmium efflux system protein